MSEDFDPYYKWLAIPPEEQPPHHYRLLGVQRFESDSDVIATAADQRMAHLRTFQSGKHSALSQQLLNEIATARVCLLNPTRKATYDQQLRASLAPQAPAAPPMAPVGPPGGPAPQYAPAFQPNAPMPIRRAAAIPVAPAASVDAQPDSAVGEMDAGPSLRSASGGRRSRKKRQSSMGAVGPLVAIGLVALVAYVAYRATSKPAASHTGTSTEETKPSTGDKPSHKIAAFEEKPPTDTGPDDEPTDPPQETVTPSVPNPRTVKPTKTPQTDLLTPAVKKILTKVANSVAKGAVEQSDPAGGAGGGTFEEIPRDGALLVGLDLAVSNYAGHLVIRAIQGVYLSTEGIANGEPHGDLGADYIKLRAKPGYAVGAMKVRGGNRVDGLSLTFMRIRNDRLDVRDSYSSAWAGGEGGNSPALITGDGRAVVGVYGGVGAELDRFGLMLDEDLELSIPSTEMPVAQPRESRPLTARPAPLPQKDRLPVPTAEAQKEAQTLIHTLFKDDFADSVKGPQQKMALAVKLFHKAEETNDDPAARYVLISEARDLAARCGDSLAVADAIVLLANNYDIDDVGMTLSSFEKAAEVTSAPLPFRRKLVENCILLIDRAVAQEKYDVAEQLVAIGRRASSKAQDGILTQRIAWRAARLREQKAAYDETREPFEVLKSKPNDPQALLAVGLYRCFYQDDWHAGSAMLAKGSDPAFKAVALQELDDQGNSNDQLKLAEAWDALGKADEKQRSNCERRAKFWYARAMPGLRGIVKAKAEKRLDELLGGRGLKAEYFRGEELAANQRVLTRIDPNINFNTGRASPGPGVPGDSFSARWTGLIVAPAKGEYVLTADHDDGVRVWIDNKIVIDRWGSDGAATGSVPFAGKARSIKVEFHNHGDARLILKWAQKSGFSEQVIPPEAFWQEQASGSKTFSPLPNPAYPATFSALPGRQAQVMEEDAP